MSNTWRYRADRGWRQQGVEWDNAKPIEVWHKAGDYVVFKVPGGKHWGSILEPSVSHPGNYVVCRLVEDRGDTLITEELFTMPLSKRGQEVRPLWPSIPSASGSARRWPRWPRLPNVTG